MRMSGPKLVAFVPNLLVPGWEEKDNMNNNFEEATDDGSSVKTGKRWQFFAVTDGF